MIRARVALWSIALIAAVVLVDAQEQSVTWAQVLEQNASWYQSAAARRVADSVLTHQQPDGGWPKNVDMTVPAPGASTVPRESTIDNGATTTHIALLARVFAATGEARYRDSALRGVEYLLDAQYPNGGWPQVYPVALRERATVAVGKAIDVILRSQIRIGGILTAWCAQHDEVTLQPRSARSYEHPSLSGSESVGIVRFLMSREHPDLRIVAAVEAAMMWFRSAALHGWRVERRTDPSKSNGWDRVMVRDPDAPPLWARFYEIGTNRPIFSGRDGMIRYTLAEIDHERRTGYAWIGDWPRPLLEKQYPAWKARLR